MAVDAMTKTPRCIKRPTRCTFIRIYSKICTLAFYFYIYVAKNYVFMPACFVVPNCCIVLIQLFSDVLIFKCLFCLLGIDEFDIV